MLVLAIGALSLAQMFVNGMWMNARAKDDTQLATIAQSQMEKLVSVGYDYLVVGGSLTTQEAGYYLDCSGAGNPCNPENNTVISSSVSDDYHKNSVKYEVYWQVSQPSGLVGGKTIRQIAVRVVSTRKSALTGLHSAAPPRELTIKTQLSNPI